MTIQEAINAGTTYLQSQGIRNPRLDTELILGDLTRRDRASMYAHSDRQLTDQELTVIWEWFDRRARNYPIQYLRGIQEFFGREFLVTPSVLVPRPETEILVETCLGLIRNSPDTNRFLDMGTGSGCIAISIACEIARLRITALDISKSALVVARKNAERLPCISQIDWLLSDGLTIFENQERQFDLIASNPPYVSLNDDSVDLAVALYEPSTSVYSGITGFEMYRHLLSESHSVLRENGYLVLELGFQQAEEVCQMADNLGWKTVQLKKDLAGIDRCAVFSRNIKAVSGTR